MPLTPAPIMHFWRALPPHTASSISPPYWRPVFPASFSLFFVFFPVLSSFLFSRARVKIFPFSPAGVQLKTLPSESLYQVQWLIKKFLSVPHPCGFLVLAVRTVNVSSHYKCVYKFIYINILHVAIKSCILTSSCIAKPCLSSSFWGNDLHDKLMLRSL